MNTRIVDNNGQTRLPRRQQDNSLLAELSHAPAGLISNPTEIARILTKHMEEMDSCIEWQRCVEATYWEE